MVPSTDWAFADCGKTAFPGSPDPTRLCLKNGVKPETVYELRYIAKDPLVLGVGLAATRDINSFFRYEKQDAAGTPNPVAGRINWSISEGSSQSGTFLKLFVMLGFNQDEAGRKVWDGDESEYLGSKHRPESPFRAAGWEHASVRARPRSAELVGRVERSGARVRHDERARSLPPDEHLPEDSGDVWCVGDLGPASVVFAGRFDGKGRHRASTGKFGVITSPEWRTEEGRVASALRLRP